MFLFEMFDLNRSKSLSLDEATVLLSCVFRAAKTVRNTPFHCTPHTVDSLVSTLFHSSSTLQSQNRSSPVKSKSSLRCCIVWEQFWTWAQRHLSAPLLAPFRQSCPLERCCAKARAYAAVAFAEKESKDPRVEDSFGAISFSDGIRESPIQGFKPGQDMEEGEVHEVDLSPSVQMRSGNQEQEETDEEYSETGIEGETSGECQFWKLDVQSLHKVLTFGFNMKAFLTVTRRWMRYWRICRRSTTGIILRWPGFYTRLRFFRTRTIRCFYGHTLAQCCR